MAVAEPVDVAVNPSDTSQRYVLWGNGRVDNIGAAPPITTPAGWVDRLDQPVAMALHIINWTTGAGYILDCQGGVQQINGAAALGSGTGGVDCTALGLPYFTNGGLGGHLYVDWSWDTGGATHFVVVDKFGQLYAVNGTNAPPRTGPRWTYPAAKRVEVSWSSGQPSKALTLDWYGGLQPDYSATAPTGGPYWRGWDAARDLVVTDWTSGSGYVLDLYGAPHPFGSATTPYGGPYKQGADVARKLVVLSSSNPLKLAEYWSGGQEFIWTVSTAPTVVAGAGVSEVQKVTITGTPTGGTFKLVFGGQTTATIAYNATAATVQTALQALSSIGSGNVTVTGGPGPGTAWTVTFTGTLAQTDVAQMTTSTVSFTGGTSPTVTVTTPTPGTAASPASPVTTTTRPTLPWSYTDAEGDSQAAWQLYVFTSTFAGAHTMTDPSVWASDATVALSGTDPSRRGVVPDVDLTNDTYVFYVRAQDTSGLWSAWSSRTWTQNVPAPTTPTGLTAIADNSTFSVDLSVSATTGGSADSIEFQCSDDGGTTWNAVRGAEAVTLATTTTATDDDIPLGVTRQYRALAYNDDPRVVSAASNTATASIAASFTDYVLTSTADPSLGGPVIVDADNPPSWTRTAVAGVFAGVGAEFYTVVSDGIPKARKTTLTLITDSTAAWSLVQGLAESASTLVYRDPFGEVIYCRLVGDWGRAQVAPSSYMHTTSLPLIEVAAPTVLDVSSTVPPGPTPLT